MYTHTHTELVAPHRGAVVCGGGGGGTGRLLVTHCLYGPDVSR